jgi:hypothetical protein
LSHSSGSPSPASGHSRIGPALRAAAPPGASVALTGFEQIQSTADGGGGGPSVLIITLIGAAGALAVLLFVYGSAIAIVPLLIAVPSILTTFLLLLGLTQVITVNFLIEYLVAVMGLGVAVDHSLLLIARWREECEAGRANEDAILAAGPTAGRAVALSGTIVAIGLLSLALLPVPFLRSIGLGGMLIPLVAIAAATTLLPVMLASFGPALDKRHVRKSSTTYSRTWESWGKLVVRRPTTRELAWRHRTASQDPPRSRAPRLTERGHVPDPDPHPRRPGGRRSGQRDRAHGGRRLHRARPRDTLLPPRPRRLAERDPNLRRQQLRRPSHPHPPARRTRPRTPPRSVRITIAETDEQDSHRATSAPDPHHVRRKRRTPTDRADRSSSCSAVSRVRMY